MDEVPDRDTLLAMPEADYMNGTQERFFKRYLLEQKAEREARLDEILEGAAGRRCWGDAMDRAVAEGNQEAQLRQAEQIGTQLRRIELALSRLQRHEYGYCLETGKPIGLKRLLLDPTAELSREAQERAERRRR